jgi:hypothetical protein
VNEKGASKLGPPATCGSIPCGRTELDQALLQPNEHLRLCCWRDELTAELADDGLMDFADFGLPGLDLKNLAEEFSARMEGASVPLPGAEPRSGRVASPPWVPPPTSV